MLVARATAEAARYVAADAILGIPYTAEELIDEIEGADAPLALMAAAPANGNGDGAEARGLAAAAGKTRTTRRKTPATPPALPDAPPAAAVHDRAAEAAARPVPPDDTPPPLISKPQMDRLHAELRDLGLGEPENRDDALTLINGWIEQPVDSTKKLTAVEARIVIDNLDAMRTIARTEEGTPDEPQP